MRIALISLSLLAVFAVAALPQQPKPSDIDETPTLKLDVELVNILFSVRDKRGGLVPNLTKENFTLTEDGKPQEIKFFTRETDLPLTLGLLVDVRRSQENLIATERHAAAQFFSSVLRPKDMAFLISFGSDAELLQDYTNSIRLLTEGLDKLRVNAQPVGFHPGPVPTMSNPRGTILYDAIYLATTEQLRNQVGRKALIVISDGMDYGSRTKLDEAVSAAHRADAIVYSIYFSDPRLYPGSDSALKRISNDTGGRVFRVSRKNTLESIFKEIQEEMRSQYALGYTSTNPNKDGSFRKIEIRSTDKDLKIQARKGYFAQPSE
jgi:VWFA-related protein